MAGKGQKKSAGKSRIKVGALKVSKETVKELTQSAARKVKGGMESETCDEFMAAGEPESYSCYTPPPPPPNKLGGRRML